MYVSSKFIPIYLTRLHFEYERVFLPLCKVADTPFISKGTTYIETHHSDIGLQILTL